MKRGGSRRAEEEAAAVAASLANDRLRAIDGLDEKVVHDCIDRMAAAYGTPPSDVSARMLPGFSALGRVTNRYTSGLDEVRRIGDARSVLVEITQRLQQLVDRRYELALPDSVCHMLSAESFSPHNSLFVFTLIDGTTPAIAANAHRAFAEIFRVFRDPDYLARFAAWDNVYSEVMSDIGRRQEEQTRFLTWVPARRIPGPNKHLSTQLSELAHLATCIVDPNLPLARFLPRPGERHGPALELKDAVLHLGNAVAEAQRSPATRVSHMILWFIVMHTIHAIADAYEPRTGWIYPPGTMELDQWFTQASGLPRMDYERRPDAPRKPARPRDVLHRPLQGRPQRPMAEREAEAIPGTALWATVRSIVEGAPPPATEAMEDEGPTDTDFS
jgi:hypothetical protein